MTLISDEYRALQNQLHAERDDYGVASLAYAPNVAGILIGLELHSLLDYGCGKGRLVPELVKHLPRGYPLAGNLYDPGNPAFNTRPSPQDLVVCIDVLEHVERHCVGAVLDDIRALARVAVMLTIHTGPAAKRLADGRNAHITQMHERDWITEYLLPRFDVWEIAVQGPNVTFIGAPRNDTSNVRRAESTARETALT